MSLADELLADLDDLEEDADDLLADLEEDDEEDADIEAIKAGSSIHDIAKLSTSEELKEVLDSIDRFTAERETRKVVGTVEDDPEYKLIVQANSLVLQVDSEIALLHKFVRDRYDKRFPELSQLVTHPLDYLRTVQSIKNDIEKSEAGLGALLPASTIMIVSVSASTTKGEALAEAELNEVLEACAMGLGVNDAKIKIFDYVESRMYFLSPNVTHICTANTAAKLLGAAGGLTGLSQMPACNVLLVGAQKKIQAGFSAQATMPHTGFIFTCDIVQSQPPEYRRKAARLVAGKVALAARVDSYQTGKSQGATVGITMRQDILKKLEKAQAPPPARLEKSLPKPDALHKKKRGGKRFRKTKDARSMSEARKAANRMGFGELQEDMYQTEMGQTLGAMSAASAGSFRTLETKKTKGGTISKKMKKRLAQQQTRAGNLSAITGVGPSGTSSVAFTPVQGLEINMQAGKKRKVDDANAKYFGRTSFAAAKKD